LKMTIEIVDFPIKNGGSFHSYVSLPEGKSHQHYQRGGFINHVSQVNFIIFRNEMTINQLK